MKRYLLLSLSLLLCAVCFGQAAHLEVKAKVAQYLIHQAWDSSLVDGKEHKPWDWADTWPVLKLKLPSNERQYVLHGANGQAMAFGPGHLTDSGLPGEGRDIVISAHRDTHFKGLEHISKEQTIQIMNREGKAFTYKVVALQVVNSEHETLVLDNQSERLRLITCYPFNALSAGGPLRYVVTALPVSDKYSKENS